MSEKISNTELDSLIKKIIKEKGLSNDISMDKMSEITKNITAQLRKPELTEVAPVNDQPVPTPTPVLEKPVNSPESISKTTTVSKDAIDLAKREGELEQREKEFAQKQSDLTVKEKDLLEKEQALAYKPQIPEVLEGIGNEQFFVFNENEISLGAEALSKTPFRLMSNPDDKRSMIELWATEGKKGADMYLVKFEKIGELVFNPFEGTANYTKKPFDDGQNPSNVPVDGLTPEEARLSQEPKESMSDIVEPKTNVTLPASADMGLNSTDLENLIKNRIDAIIIGHFSKYPKM
ncbi:MAG TPA: hypothetical protein VNX68_12590 [Nitrosopumilaceae archaeon]|jgi:hypothetical protein|nr:hypothetical protein [Nitrosopumilaceae archaeon]